jgi:hypothetical protein
MQSNGLDRQITFKHVLSNKIFEFFISIVYLNSFLNNVAVPSANIFCSSSVSGLNSSTFFHLNIVYFFGLMETHFRRMNYYRETEYSNKFNV